VYFLVFFRWLFRIESLVVETTISDVNNKALRLGDNSVLHCIILIVDYYQNKKKRKVGRVRFYPALLL
jgi:hypothetical protein